MALDYAAGDEYFADLQGLDVCALASTVRVGIGALHAPIFNSAIKQRYLSVLVCGEDVGVGLVLAETLLPFKRGDLPDFSNFFKLHLFDITLVYFVHLDVSV